MRKLVEDADLVPRGLGVSKASRALLAEAEADASRVVVRSRGVDGPGGHEGDLVDEPWSKAGRRAQNKNPNE